MVSVYLVSVYPSIRYPVPVFSTMPALLDCANDWFNMVVLIDLEKAFDTVDHKIVLRKLEYYGMKGEALALFS